MRAKRLEQAARNGTAEKKKQIIGPTQQLLKQRPGEAKRHHIHQQMQEIPVHEGMSNQLPYPTAHQPLSAECQQRKP